MLIKSFVDEGLGNTSYLLASEETGRAVLIDAERDVDRYLAVAEGLGLRLAYALDTHLHNDFVSGAREAAARANLTIGASAGAGLAFDHLPLSDEASISLGDLLIETLATPGHTTEHVSYVVRRVDEEVSAVFTGGALTVGGAARTDLMGPELTSALTRQLYHTIQHRLLRLGDHVAVYPTHGAGSFCAAPASSARTSTIGQERRHNSLVRAASEAEFTALALEDLPSYPTYFRYMRDINRRGPRVLGGLPLLPALSAYSVQAAIEAGVAVLDTRSPHEFTTGHVPASYGIPLGTPLVTWAGWVVPFGTPLILIAATADERIEAVRQLIRIGYDDLRGYLDGGMASWQTAGLPVEQMTLISPDRLLADLEHGTAPIILDVRQDSEWRGGHLPGAQHIEAGYLATVRPNLPKESPIVVHCASGDRSTVALSLLARQGYRSLALLNGGFSAWHAAGYPVTTANPAAAQA